MKSVNGPRAVLSFSCPLRVLSLIALFFSLVVAFWNAEDTPAVRDAYLEGWPDGRAGFDAALRVGNIAHLFKWLRIRDGMERCDRGEFDERWFPRVLRKTLEYV